MKIETKMLPRWPKLAWVAKIIDGNDVVLVYHGPYVEISDDWVVEAIWAGDFAKGDFDKTDLVFGTGVRCRNNHVDFITSGTLFDRIIYGNLKESWYFSNSLPALLAVADLKLQDDYLNYSTDAGSIVCGLENRVSTIPTNDGLLNSIYFNNIRFDGNIVKEEPKPDTAPLFKSYQDYKQFLRSTVKKLGNNLSAAERKHQVLPLTSISSGYDSCATAVISREAGCGRAVTIRDSASLWRGSDSGLKIAQHLGMSCTEHPRTAKNFPDESAVWAAEGKSAILSWTLFDYPEPLCLFFTGCHGEKMWDRVSHDHPDPFVRRDTASLGFCEVRLLRGVFQCVMPFWGVRHSMELRKVTESAEMAPWYTNKDYDKPIARRIIQEAGVPGDLFGQCKRNTSHEASFKWPYSKTARNSYESFLRDRSQRTYTHAIIKLLRIYSKTESLLYKNTFKKFGVKRGPQFWLRVSNSNLLFQWANNELRQLYRSGFN